MTRVRIICEGRSEEILGEQVIQPHLSSLGIFASSTQIVTKRKASQKDSKGGMPSYLRVKNDILRHLSGDLSLRAVTSMFDLYALPADFPGYSDSCKISDFYKKVEFIEKSFAEDIDDKRFIPYIQLHEYEALFFSDINTVHEILSINNPERSLNELEKILRKESNPEFINNGQLTAPSKRIKNLYPDYSKTVDAIRIIQRIGLSKIREKCEHFNQWLTRLESLILTF